ncbi:MAG: ABC transporter ATP-binding protein [Desulfobacterota bacterium]|nr:ABC transporter ATP-binding protein [Thermodesulfobacteriota bacterium]
MISGLIHPSRGRILVAGIDLQERPREAKRKIGIVPQSLSFYPSLSARENLSFFGRLYGLGGRPLQRRIAECLAFVHLEDRAGERVGRFSHGLMRRLNIAIGLLHDPQLLILDEPTAGLDPQSRAEILQGLRALNRSGTTVFYTTHYLEEAQALCRLVAVMDQGRIIALDEPRSLIRNLGSGIVRIVFGQPVGAALRKRLEGLGKIRVVDRTEKQFHLQVGDTDQALKALVSLQAEAHLPLKALEMLEPNLETVFIQLTGRAIRD